MGPVRTVGSSEQAVLRPCAQGRWGVRWGGRHGDGGLAGSTVQSGDAVAGRAVSVGRDASDSELLEPRRPLRGFRMLGARLPGLASLCGGLLWAPGGLFSWAHARICLLPPSAHRPCFPRVWSLSPLLRLSRGRVMSLKDQLGLEPQDEGGSSLCSPPVVPLGRASSPPGAAASESVKRG